MFAKMRLCSELLYANLKAPELEAVGCGAELAALHHANKLVFLKQTQKSLQMHLFEQATQLLLPAMDLQSNCVFAELTGQ